MRRRWWRFKRAIAERLYIYACHMVGYFQDVYLLNHRRINASLKLPTVTVIFDGTGEVVQGNWVEPPPSSLKN